MVLVATDVPLCRRVHPGHRGIRHAARAQILFGPARVFSFLLQSLLPIRFARALADEGEGSLTAQIAPRLWPGVTSARTYCILLALFPRLILTKVFDPQYAQEPYVLSLYSAQAMMTYWLMVIAAALSAKRMTRDIFYGSVVSTIAAVLFCWPLIRAMGMSGVIACMMVSTTAMAIYLVMRYRTSLRGAIERERPIDFGNQEPACAR